jgi:hypothetical protein
VTICSSRWLVGHQLQRTARIRDPAMALNASNDIADIIANHGQTYARPIGSSCVI